MQEICLGKDVVAVSVGNDRPRTISVSLLFFSVSVSGYSTFGERFVVFPSPGHCFISNRTPVVRTELRRCSLLV